MALNIKVGQLTQPGSTGNQTISLPANFDPKAIILWGSSRTLNGVWGAASDRHYFGLGVGTYRGGSVQQAFATNSAVASDAASTNSSHGNGTDALLKALSIGTATVDMEIALVSMQTGATSEVVINWVDLFTTGSVLVNYMIFGGSDITDAVVTAPDAPGSTPTDFTVSGFGQPDAIFVFNAWQADGTIDAAHCQISAGWVTKSGANYCTNFASMDASAVNAGSLQKSGAFIHNMNTGLARDYEGASTAIGWPTDGWRAAWTGANPVDMIGQLWLKGTFQIAVGQGTNPTSGTPPVDQDLGLSFTPVGAWIQSAMAPSSTSIQNAVTDGPGFMVGASDGATDLAMLMVEDDANTAQRRRERSDNDRIVVLADNAGGTGTVRANADWTNTATDQLHWQTVNATARAYVWVAFGSASAGGTTLTLDVGDSSSLSDSIAKVFGKTVADTSSQTDSYGRVAGFNRTFVDTLTSADALSKALGITLADAAVLTDALAKRPGKNVADTTTPSDALVKSVAKAMADASALSDSLTRVVGYIRAWADVSTLTDDAVIEIATGAITHTLNVNDVTTTADAVQKTLTRAFSDVAALTDAIQKTIGTTKVDASSLTDALTKGYKMNRADQVALADALAKHVALSFADEMALSDDALIQLQSVASAILLTRMMMGYGG